MRGPVWSTEQLDLAVQEFIEVTAIVTKAVATDGSWLGPLGSAAAKKINTVRLTVRHKWGNLIPGVAADYAIRMLRSILRSYDDTHEFLKGDGLTDLLESPDAKALLTPQHLACVAALRLLRGLDSPAIASLVPNPFQGETTHLRGERLLGYARLAPTASSKLEREVILRLRTAGHSDRSVEGIVLMYDDALRGLA